MTVLPRLNRLWLLAAFVPLLACPPAKLEDPRAAVPKQGYRLAHRDIAVAIDAQLRLAVQRLLPTGKRHELAAGRSSLYGVRVDGKERRFAVEPANTTIVKLEDALGSGKRFTVIARELPALAAKPGEDAPPPGPLELEVALTYYQRYPKTLFTRATLRNRGKQPIAVQAIIGPRLHLPPRSRRWALQGAALAWGKDIAFPLKAGYRSQNPTGWQPGLGGGGLPINDFWTPAGGVALGHREVGPRHLELPISVGKDGSVEAWLQERGQTLAPGATLGTVNGFITAHGGDFYQPVSIYRAMLTDQGAKPPKPPLTAYEPIWCSWGYEFDVRPEEILGVLPKLAALGIRWVVLDDRWFDAYGDWGWRPELFGKDGAKLKALVSAIHARGMLAKLWWIPLVAEVAGARYESHVYKTAKVAQQHPDWIQKGADGKPLRGIRKLAYLDPTLPGVQAYTRALVERFIREWGFDGHKLDVVFSHPPLHGDARPERSAEAMAQVYRQIYETTAKLKPQAVTEICPCGTTPYHAWLPYLNQAVTADPVGGVQMRRRIKLLKALFGPRFAVYADHVELSQVQGEREVGEDFASAVGTGAVVGTKFVWPASPRRLKPDRLLTPAKEAHWKHWLSLYKKKMLARGRYVGALYDLAFDLPEAHVVRTQRGLNYAFYAPKPTETYRGKVTFKGPLAGTFEVLDYTAADGKLRLLGRISEAQRSLTVTFEGSLLVELRPVAKR